jgi:hypothetical protein
MTTNTKIPNDFSKKSPFKELFVPGTGVKHMIFYFIVLIKYLL